MSRSRTFRRPFSGLGVCLLILGLGAGCSPAPRTAPDPAPLNLLLISLDTVRADRLGSYGHARASTPNLDRIAAEGILFEQVSATAPLTLPAHASLLSGLLPLQHGLRLNGAGRFPDHLETLATHLAREGYRNAAFVGAFVLDQRFGLERGFELYDDEIERSVDAQLHLEAERPAAEVIDRALIWLDDLEDTAPFFVWVHLYDAHAPYTPPPPHDTRHPDPYDGEIAYLDAEIGRLLRALEGRGVDEDTVIAVVGDHGEALGYRGEASHGMLLYEPTLHVPWLLRAPGLAGGERIGTALSLVDVAPTVASILGHPFVPRAAGDELRGRDLAEALRAGAEIEPLDLYAETGYPATFGWSALATLRRGTLKYILGARGELYDLATDPGEEHDLSDARRRELHRLAERLEELQSTAAEPAGGEAAAPDAETRARLAALGYVGTAGVASVRPGQGADPAARIGAYSRWEEAHRAIESGRPQSVLAELEELVSEDPENPVFRSSLARAHRQLGHLERAIALYRQAIARRPEDPAAWYDLAATLAEAGRDREAIEAGREALRRDPGRTEGLNLLGISYLREGDLERALEHFSLAIELDPRDATAHNNLANALRAGGETASAAAAYHRAAELQPDYPDPWNGLGALAIEEDRFDVAIAHLDRALGLAPDFHQARLNRGIAYEMAGRYPQAIAEYRDLLARTEGRQDSAPLRLAAGTLLQQLEEKTSGLR